MTETSDYIADPAGSAMWVDLRIFEMNRIQNLTLTPIYSLHYTNTYDVGDYSTTPDAPGGMTLTHAHGDTQSYVTFSGFGSAGIGGSGLGGGGQGGVANPSVIQTGAIAAPKSTQQACQLVAPAGNFTSSPGTIAQFQPTFADSLGAAILNLNQLGITPVMTDGFRTADMQSARVAAASSGLSPFGAALGISAHQVGMAADFGINSNAPNNLTVYNTMVTQGLQNGAGFHPSDPVHFQDPEARQNQTAAMASSCSAAYAAGGHH
jgi:hypothetical protein